MVAHPTGLATPLQSQRNHTAPRQETAAMRLCSTSRVMTTTTSRPVPMIFPEYNLNPVIDVRRLW